MRVRMHALHLGAAQVEVAILQPDFLVRILVRVERQRLGLVEDLDLRGHDLDAAGLDLVVHRVARAHRAGDAQHVLVADLLGHREHVRRVRLGQHLHDAFVVAQVDEAQPAEVAGDVGPAAQGDALADQGLADEAAVMGTHRNSGTAPARHGVGSGRKGAQMVERRPAGGKPVADPATPPVRSHASGAGFAIPTIPMPPIRNHAPPADPARERDATRA
jgi:hypothetical protein